MIVHSSFSYRSLKLEAIKLFYKGNYWYLRNLHYIHTMEYCLAIKRNKYATI